MDRPLKPTAAGVDTGCMNTNPERLAVSLSALIAEILAENPDDKALRPLTMAPTSSAIPGARALGGGVRDPFRPTGAGSTRETKGNEARVAGVQGVYSG